MAETPNPAFAAYGTATETTYVIAALPVFSPAAPDAPARSLWVVDALCGGVWLLSTDAVARVEDLAGGGGVQ